MTACGIAYELVNTPEHFAAVLPKLAQAPSLALDMEMENHYHLYGLHIALLQFSTPDGRHFIIDPLSDIDLQPLAAILADAAHALILHDADFDRRAAHQIYGWQLQGVFDTKIAAQFCGHRKFGLASLLQEFFGVTTNKRFQTINWMTRPLSANALEYAMCDTAYLHALRDRFTARLAELGRSAWVTEEIASAARRSTQEAALAPLPAHHRIKRSALLTGRQLAVLGKLAAFRDSLAREINRPLHYVMRNEIMLNLAMQPKLTANQLRQLQGVHPALHRPPNIKSLLAAWRDGQTAPEEQHASRLRGPRAAPNAKQRLKDMHSWRVTLAAEYDLEPYLLLDNDVLGWCAAHPDLPLPPRIADLIRVWQKTVAWQGFVEKFSLPPLPEIQCAIRNA